ncbi:MAG: phage major capsid protein [Candidatus Puniceispirillum sp.]|nr:phage major capsid protein [Candidatus Pelagibacter sp.]MBA4283529.1 phage major capsid protein [Candidatus Puniceispirillum sp.]
MNISTTIEQTLNHIEDNIKEIHHKQNQKMNQIWNHIQSATVTKASNNQENSMNTTYFNKNKKTSFQDASLKQFIKSGINSKSLNSQADSAGYMMSHAMQDYLYQNPIYDGSIRSLARVTSIESDSYEVLKDKKAPVVGWI